MSDSPINVDGSVGGDDFSGDNRAVNTGAAKRHAPATGASVADRGEDTRSGTTD